MNLLALETSSSRLSVALAVRGEVLTRAAEVANGGSEFLLPWIHELLAEAALPFAALDGIAFGAGPGGFTGLRLACGVAQGLAYGLDLPVVGVSTLEAVALNAGQSRVLACIDARMGEVYVAAYEVDELGVHCLMSPMVVPPQQVSAPEGDVIHGCGDGFAAYADVLISRLPHLASVNAEVYPTATAILRLAEASFARGEGKAAVQAMPLYVRDKVALTTRERLARGGVK